MLLLCSHVQSHRGVRNISSKMVKKKKISCRENLWNSQTSGMVSSGTSSLDSCSTAATSGSACFVPADLVLLKRAVTVWMCQRR